MPFGEDAEICMGVRRVLGAHGDQCMRFHASLIGKPSRSDDADRWGGAEGQVMRI